MAKAISLRAPNPAPSIASRMKSNAARLHSRFGAKPPYFPFAVHSEMIPQVFKNLKDIPFNSVGINEYLKNQEIPWHIDDPKAGPKIYIISLMSDATLKFRKDNQALEYYLPRFSLATISDDLRYNWQHYLKADDYRISVVFRNF